MSDCDARNKYRVNPLVSHKLALLTCRERDVLKLICEGETSSSIATTLGITKGTAWNHRNRVNRKLGDFASWAERISAVGYRCYGGREVEV